MKTIYYIYIAGGLALGYLSWSIPITIMALYWSEPARTILLTLLYTPLIVIVAFLLYWVPRYYDSINFELTDSELIVSRGVFWRVKNIVPYNRITNIDIVQGPISRLFNVATLKIQTAGYSGARAVKSAEAVLEYLEDYEEMREYILGRTRSIIPVAVEAGEASLASIIVKLEEIIKILREISRSES